MTGYSPRRMITCPNCKGIGWVFGTCTSNGASSFYTSCLICEGYGVGEFRPDTRGEVRQLPRSTAAYVY